MAPILLLFVCTILAWGGTILVWGAQAVIWGAQPRNAPHGAGPVPNPKSERFGAVGQSWLIRPWI